jgi:predicted nucleic acid-binding protein
MAKTKIAICDTSGLVSLLKADDSKHRSALKVARVLTEAAWQVIVPHEVYAETINVFGKKLGRETAVRAGEALLQKHDERELVLVPCDKHVLKRALTMQARYSGSPSFVDCLVMAMADEHATVCIFGFDATSKSNGYFLPDQVTV